MSQFSVDVLYIPGIKNQSDGPSRLLGTNDPNLDLINPPKINNTAVSGPNVGTYCAETLKNAQKSDETLQIVSSWVKSGQKPVLDNNIQKMDPIIKTYYNSINRLKLHMIFFIAPGKKKTKNVQMTLSASPCQ